MPSQSRRVFLKTLGTGSLALGAGLITGVDPRPAIAQTSTSTPGFTGFSRFNVGNMVLTVIADGVADYGLDIYSVNAEKAEVEALLVAHHQPIPVPVGFNILLIESGERKILVDVGWGDFQPITLGLDGLGGGLLSTLAMLGLANTDITDVILTHYHPDHIAGLSSNGQANFPNATVHFPAIEHGFIQADPPVEALAGVFEIAHTMLAPVIANDQLQLYTPDTEVLPGIHAVNGIGHTPGQCALLFDSEGEQLLHLADVAVHPLMHFAHPDWLNGYDTLPEETVATRMTLLGRAADEGLPISAYHLPFPGIGMVIRDGEAFRYISTII